MSFFKRSASTAKKKTQKTPFQFKPTSLMMAVEPRIMFDAAIAATVVDTQHKIFDSVEKPIEAPSGISGIAETLQATESKSVVANPEVPKSILFVDSRIADADQLLKDLKPNTDVVFLDKQHDGLKQIADYLIQHPGATDISIIAHGNTGDLWLGNSYVSSDSLNQYADSLASIGSHMQAGGDILIYACNTAPVAPFVPPFLPEPP